MTLARTPFFSKQISSGAKMVPFAGWEMPIQYTGIIEEHNAVRTSAGLFDVSHMGSIIIRGAGAKDTLSNVLTNNINLAVPGKGIYTHLLRNDGTVIDDAIVYNLGEAFLLVPNASAKDAVVSWLKDNRCKDTEIIDVSSGIACLAIQGPKAAAIAQRITADNVTEIKRFNTAFASLGRGEGFLGDILASGRKKDCMFARTGYTGEDGFEILVEEKAADILWESLVKAGGDGMALAGLGARDTLRLEKGMLLSGTDFDGTQTSLQTGPPWVVKFDHDFIGRRALEAQRDIGNYNALVGLATDGKNIPRHGYGIFRDGKNAGYVTSGTLSPVLKRGIALGYVPLAMSSPGNEFDIEIRGRYAKTTVVKLPFL
ncbi:MAG: glycine cleavage system aminomethyltransferase GcvT [Methanomassiliicoccaceae archaeon]|jgi:aminomethyltransferase|nr:glycine cleavage system aminomethyltransferase GcvT [Methanomassiliicoccaceae archaeon]